MRHIALTLAICRVSSFFVSISAFQDRQRWGIVVLVWRPVCSGVCFEGVVNACFPGYGLFFSVCLESSHPQCLDHYWYWFYIVIQRCVKARCVYIQFTTMNQCQKKKRKKSKGNDSCSPLRWSGGGGNRRKGKCSTFFSFLPNFCLWKEKQKLGTFETQVSCSSVLFPWCLNAL